MVSIIRPVQTVPGLTAPFFIANEGEESVKFSLILTQALQRMVVRLTGGCGYMSPEDAEGLYELFIAAFAGYAGAILFGGTRMLARTDFDQIVPSITEIPPLIQEANPGCRTLGVIPKVQDLGQMAMVGNVVSDEGGDYFTIAHPYQSTYLVVQQTVDAPVIWDVEYRTCLAITYHLRAYAGFQSLLVSYNGGGTTEKEIVATAKRGWPVLLVAGSGRKTDEYARDADFLRCHPSVIVCAKEADSMRSALVEAGVVIGKMGELRALPQLRGHVS